MEIQRNINKAKARELANRTECNGMVCWQCKEYAALETAEWKEQQMIEKACEWLEDMACYYAHWEYNGDTYEKEIVFDTQKFIEDFQKAMEGGEE